MMVKKRAATFLSMRATFLSKRAAFLFLVAVCLLLLRLSATSPSGISLGFAKLRCDCNRIVRRGSASSTCSARATARGPGQHVVSYSLFGSRSTGGWAPSDYHRLLPEICDSIKAQYPGWVIRIYTDYKPEVPEQREWMCKMECNFPHVDFCLVDRLPELGDVTRFQDQGTTWRFLPGMDPLVDVFISRDTDSLVIARERDAVREWLDSDSMFHAMRDHPRHGSHVLAGMWGAKAFLNRSLMASLTARMLFDTDSERKYGSDQDLLRVVLWPAAKHLMLVHDSYFCTNPEYEGPKHRPFPTRRENGYFASYSPRHTFATWDVRWTECPVECRPREHEDWRFC